MTQANDFSGQDDLHRTVRALDRRTIRLEDTQITDRELGMRFDRVYLEIDGLALEVRELRQEVREVKLDIRELKTEMGGVKEDIAELSSKFDIIMQYITGNGSSGSQHQ